MAGIAGYIRTDGRPADPAVLRAMADRLAHRAAGSAVGRPAHRAGGPPHVVTDGPAGLATLDPAGLVSTGDGAVCAVCDAPLPDAPDLARFAGDAPAALESLPDPFALAVWDGARRRLLLARDRLGTRPLYWCRGEAGLAFASEPAALLGCPNVPRRFDAATLGDFLRFACVPAPATGFEGIRHLPPAHFLLFDAAAGHLDGPRRWWDIPRGPPQAGVPPAARVAGGGRTAAVLLSGGLDSSIIAALAAEAAGGTLRTVTAAFEEAGWDESAHARTVAERLGAEHTEIRVRPDAIEAAPDLVATGVLLADSSALALATLAREVGATVPAALSGDGGDESFGGYPRHGALWWSERMPGALRRLLAPLGRWMPPRPGRKSTWNAARRFASALDLPPLERYLAWRSLFQDRGPTGKRGGSPYPPRARADATGCAAGAETRRAPSWGAAGPASLEGILAPDVAAEALAADPLARWRDLVAGLEDRPWIDRAMAIDLLDYLPNDGLAKVDTAAAAQGLAVRSPMLHPAVVELARRMPWDVKWRPRLGRLPQGKRVLRAAFADRLPPAVLRRGKAGFGVPVSRWLAGPYAEWARDVLLGAGARTAPLLRRKAVAALLSAHTTRRADHGERLWALLCLELWMRAVRV
ncbi:MAG: asparagine synthase-related protein [Phycisphaerae bacterium]